MSERIAIYLPSLRGGGAERVCVTLANAFVRAGHAVDMVLVTREGPYLKDLDQQVRIVDLHCRRVITSLFKLVSYLRRERPVALLSTFHHANIMALAARTIARAGTRVVVRAQNMRHRTDATGNTLLARLVSWLAPKFYRTADGIVAVSAGVSADLSRAEPRLTGRIRVINNPVVSGEILARARQPVAHEWLGGTRPVLLAVGRLAVAKDYRTLLKAFALLRKGREARLLILGEGGERAALEALSRELGVEQDVALPGFEENPFAYMARADVFVLSSQTEGSPNVLVQALALGARIVATDCPSGPREILQGGRLGILVGVGDVEAMAAALAESLDHPPRPVPEEAIAGFRVDTVARQYLAVLMKDMT